MKKISLISKMAFASALSFFGYVSSAKAQINVPSGVAPGSNVVGGELQVNVGGGGFAEAPVVPPTSTGANGNQLLNIIDLIDRVVNAAFIILIGIVFVLFMYNLVMYLKTKEADYQKAMIRDFIIVFVAVAVWGIVTVVSRLLGIGVGGTGVRPAI